MTEMGCKTILITGATSGIGQAAAARLASLGHSVVIAGRNPDRCRATSGMILKACGRPVEFLLADLSSQTEVRRLAQDFLQRFDRLDVLINNAGAVYIRRELSADGIEKAWAVNYFQAFLLTRLLLERLKASAPARIINLSSVYHWAARLRPGRFDECGPYIGWNVYARTKLASLYFTYELASRLAGSGVSANAIHPGLVATGMGKTSGLLLRSVFRLVDLFAVTPEKGAEGLVHLALSPDLHAASGNYFNGVRIARSSPVSRDEKAALRLWQASEHATGILPGERLVQFAGI